MSRIPLSALAGVLIVTAVRMNNFGEIKHYFSKKLRHSQIQFLLTMAATVIFDLTIAIAVGIVAAVVIFFLKSCRLHVRISDPDAEEEKDIKIITPTGSLFFGTQNRLTRALENIGESRAVIFRMQGVPNIDDSAIEELKTIVETYKSQQTAVLFCGLHPEVQKTMQKAGFTEIVGEEQFFDNTEAALASLPKKQLAEPAAL